MWAHVKGPATAVVATTARIGWTFVDACSVTTALGATIDFMVDPPRVVVEMVFEAVKRWMWKHIELTLPHLAVSGTWCVTRSKKQAMQFRENNVDLHGVMHRHGVKDANRPRQIRYQVPLKRLRR